VRRLASLAAMTTEAQATVDGIIAVSNEVWALEESIDAGVDRTVFFVEQCPYHKEQPCSHQAWKNARAWSFESKEKVIAYVARHLVKSSYHGLSIEDAVLVASSLDVQDREQTWHERKHERDEAKAAVAKQEKKQLEEQQQRQQERLQHERERVQWEREQVERGQRDRNRDGHRDGHRGRSRSPARYHGRRGDERDSGYSAPGSSGSRPAVGAPVPRAPAAPPELAGSPSSREFADATANLATVSERLDRLSSRLVASSGSGSPGMVLDQGAGTVTTLAPFTVRMNEGVTAEVPVSALRLLCNSVKTVRQHIEQLQVMVPVLAAAESALQHHIAN